MKNYIYLDGNKIEISDETAENMKKQFQKNLTYRDIKSKVTNWWIASQKITNEETCDSVNNLIKLINVAKYLNGDWLPNWSDDTYKSRFYISIQNRILISNSKNIPIGTVYFKSDKLCNQAIEILGEDIIKSALTLNL